MGLVFPPHPTYLQMDRKLCEGKKAELTFTRSELWLQLYHAAYDLRSLIYNAHVGASGSRRGQLWRDVSAGGGRMCASEGVAMLLHSLAIWT